MESADLAELVGLMRASRTDLARVEVKAASGGLPKSVRDTISAFSNGDGGTVVLGLDERHGFAPAEGFEPGLVQSAVASACADDLEPPVRAEVELVMFDGRPVVVVEVPELDPRFKPCYVKAKGEYGGSFLRGGDGDRRLTDFEIHLLHTNRGEPRDDLEPVSGASLSDLNGERLAQLLERVRRLQPRAFADVPNEVALQRLNVLAAGEVARPTLAGLLAFGTYPQQVFPQLDVTFVAYPGVTPDDRPPGTPRFLDSRAFNGPIPDIVADVIPALVRNMSIGARIEGIGREDVYDYPIEALREAIVNALVHRDYSVYSRSAPVQITMFIDRLVIANPGGLYGAITPDDLGREGITSSRNPALIKLLQDTRVPDSDRMVCENRGSGIPAMLGELRRAGAPPPEFKHRLPRFSVILHNAAAQAARTVAASAYAATVRVPGQPDRSVPADPVAATLSALGEHGEMTRMEIQEVTGLAQATVLRYLKSLTEAGLVQATAPPRSPHRRYRLASGESR